MCELQLYQVKQCSGELSLGSSAVIWSGDRGDIEGIEVVAPRGLKFDSLAVTTD